MLELQKIDFGTISTKVRRVECGENEEMSRIKGETMSQLTEIDTILEEKIDQGASNVNQIKSKINALNDSVTKNVNSLKKLNQQHTSFDRKTSKKNASTLRQARKASQGIDNRFQAALRKLQKQG